MQPDWALDGQHIVFAGDNASKNATKDRAGGPLLQWIGTTISAGGVAFGNVETLQPAVTNVMYGYPMFNPTSEYISFVRGKTIEKDLTDQIWLIKAAADGETAVNVTRANTLVGDSNAPAVGVENNMPTWAPSTGPDVQWIAFASKRDYGSVWLDDSTASAPCAVVASKPSFGASDVCSLRGERADLEVHAVGLDRRKACEPLLAEPLDQARDGIGIEPCCLGVLDGEAIRATALEPNL